MLKANQMFLKCFYDNAFKIALTLPPSEFFCAKCDIYRLKLNEAHFYSGTVIIRFLDEPYQETNFKSVLLFKI